MFDPRAVQREFVMIIIAGVLLLLSGLLIWFFGLRPYVLKNGGQRWDRANIAATMWYDFDIALELRTKTGTKCIWVEVFAICEALSLALIITGVITLM